MMEYLAPSWDAPIDVEGYIRAIPAGALIKGMYPGAIAAEGKRRKVKLAHAADRYLPFYEYPLRDHMSLVVEAANAFWPDLPRRQGLRKLGRAAVVAFLQTTFGKAVLGGLTQPETVARALSTLVRAYGTSLSKPTPQVEVIEASLTSCVLKLRDAWLLLDSQQIGIIEGYCNACGVRADVRVAVDGLANADFLCAWESAPRSSRPSEPRR